MTATGRWGTANWQRIADKRNDPGTVGTWALAVSGGRWVLKIDGAGGYDFHSEANDGAASHAGRFAASDGYWWLLATNGYADGGTYNLGTPDVFSATGHLGNGAWLRDKAWAKQTAQSAADGNSQALQTLTTAAQRGDPEAEYALGEYYDVQKDQQQTAAWWQKAADQGQAEAQYNMGALYQNGEGVPQDSGEAVSWYTKAAAQGDAEAELQLGNAYSKGRGVEQSDSLAVSWWKKAAEQHNSDAETKLSFAYRDGKGVPKDMNAYFRWNMQSVQDLMNPTGGSAGKPGQ